MISQIKAPWKNKSCVLVIDFNCKMARESCESCRKFAAVKVTCKWSISVTKSYPERQLQLKRRRVPLKFEEYLKIDFHEWMIIQALLYCLPSFIRILLPLGEA